MDNGSREAKRIQKEIEQKQIAELVDQISPVLNKIPSQWMRWDINESQRFKKFHAYAIKKIKSQRRKLSDIILVKEQMAHWYK